MALVTLSIDLEARLAKLEAGMSAATRIAEKNAAAIEARYAKIGNAVRTVAGDNVTFAGDTNIYVVASALSGGGCKGCEGARTRRSVPTRTCSSRCATGCMRKAVIGAEGARNHTW